MDQMREGRSETGKERVWHEDSELAKAGDSSATEKTVTKAGVEQVILSERKRMP